MTKLNPVYRIFSVFFGTTLTAFAIFILLKSGYGTDTLSVFLTGVQNHIPLEFGYLSMLFNCLVIIAAFFIKRELIGPGTIINGFGIGIILNFFFSIFGDWELSFSLIWAVAAAVLYGVGIGFYVSAQMGSAAIECLSFILEAYSKFSLRVVRITLDTSLVIVGILLGSKDFHVATFICLLATGPIVEWMLRKSMKIEENRSE
ncbi:membrane protein [Enterococcus sp. BWT-B8]|uniref:YczE/YyaS/YitT family protein n=1 Tax=unclassified Enterococcus TaxID=2608891 RepID=UPI001E33EBB8|nr:MULTISPECIES: membrane protein [unclassified Enterococcus]MCB5951637.1 membrane protein [Enterococcus sp. BWT-B8]MCB5954729.1 membrane protein [Enterococcus sp. CWB-B31]